MEDITKLNDKEKLEKFDELRTEDCLTEEVIESALRIEDDFTRQKAIMILEEKSRKLSQARNFQKLLGIIKQKIRNSSVQDQEYKTKLDGLDLVLNTGEWICDKDGVRRFVNRNGCMIEEIASWQPIIITNIYYNTELLTYRVQLAFKESEFSKIKTITVNKSMIANSSNITNLADLGISITNQTAPLLVKYLNDLERLNVDIIPRSNAISRLGWIEDNGFVPYNSEISFDGETMYGELFNSVKCCGDYEKWKEMVDRETGIEARMVLGSSFASPIVGLLNTLTFFTHLWGNTGNGKSVALHFAQSIWGNPCKLVQNLNGTAVALERLAGFFCNLPLCLDELQTLKKTNTGRDGSFDDILYKLGQGRGKSRGRKDGSIDRVQSWAMSIITTGEEPITNDNSGGGAKNRVLDIYCKDAIFTSATKVIKTCQNNYGWAGKEYIEKLINFIDNENGKEKISDIYDKFFDYIIKSNPTEKQAMAAVMVAIGYSLMKMFIFNETEDKAIEIGFKFLDEIRPMLINVTDINNVENFYMDILGFVVQNKHHFIFNQKGGTEYNPSDNRLEIWGKITDRYIYITKQIMNKFCLENNTNYRKMSKALVDTGKLEPSIGANGTRECTKPVRINNVQVRCLAFRRPTEEQLSTVNEDLIPIDDDSLPF